MTRRRRPPVEPFGHLVAHRSREWIGTPFLWGQSTRQVSVDCKGLVRGVAADLGRPEADSFHGLFVGYRPDRPVPSQLLLEGMAALFDRVAGETEPGDVLILKMRDQPQHLAIVTFDGLAVHARPPRVKETRLAALLQLCPLHSAWRWRNLSMAIPSTPAEGR